MTLPGLALMLEAVNGSITLLKIASQINDSLHSRSITRYDQNGSIDFFGENTKENVSTAS